MILYTIDEVAKMLSIHPRTVRRFIEKGRLKGEKVGGNWRVSEEAVKEMFDDPEIKDSITCRLEEKNQDMLSLYLQGKHRLQQNGNNHVVLLMFVFSPEKETWFFLKTDGLMTRLKQLGEKAQFDFAMTGNEQGLYRLTLIAPPLVAQEIAKELEYMSK